MARENKCVKSKALYRITKRKKNIEFLQVKKEQQKKTKDCSN